MYKFAKFFASAVACTTGSQHRCVCCPKPWFDRVLPRTGKPAIHSNPMNPIHSKKIVVWALANCANEIAKAWVLLSTCNVRFPLGSCNFLPTNDARESWYRYLRPRPPQWLNLSTIEPTIASQGLKRQRNKKRRQHCQCHHEAPQRWQSRWWPRWSVAASARWSWNSPPVTVDMRQMKQWVY